jgi:hypothetical protein
MSCENRSDANRTESMEQQPSEASLPTAVHALENDELQALLVALLREWRERVAMTQAARLPAAPNT